MRSLCRPVMGRQEGEFMISAWNLVWIVPFSASFGAACMAILSANKPWEVEE